MIKNIIITLLNIIVFQIGLISAQNTFPGSGPAGIGTLNPDVAFHIITGSDSRPEGASAPAFPVLKFSRPGTPNYAYPESAEFRIAHGGSHVWGSRLDLYVNGGSNQTNIPDQHTMSWLYNGNVGIGTQTPRSLLDVGAVINEGKLGAVLGRLQEGNEVGEGTFLGVRGYNTTDAYGFKSFGLEHSFYGVTNSSINFLRGESQTGGGISFNTNRNNEQMRLDWNGNLLIGKATQANPSYKLDVNGKARANEITVNSNGADFVFEEDYKLIPLDQLEDFIKRFKHLPEIPDAKTMQQNGVGIGELQTKLLQKVEELTLHLIEKDKELAQEKKLNAGNQDRLLRLEMALETLKLK
ncbi:MAG: hypothetical protein EOO45_00255 [Flavobacterium sp.]|nr:MAG: hypothetical protein EOO45_00255 [Flavobacterium sp.]